MIFYHKNYIVLLILFLLLLPNFIFVTFNLNGLFVPTMFVFILVSLISNTKNTFQFTKDKLFIVFAILLFSIFGILQTNDFFKIFVSWFLFALVMFSSKGIYKLFYISFKEEFYQNRVLISMIIILLFNMFFDINFGNYSKQNSPFFPFREPSHFFITFSPWLITCNKLKNPSFWLISTVLTCIYGLFFESALAILVGFISFCIRYRFNALIIISFLVFVFFNDLINNIYIMDRFLLNDNNLTAAVWIRGWNEIFYNLKNTNFFGSGFQTLGFFGNSSPYAQNLQDIFRDIENINLKDGGFLSVKILSEFGLFGIVFIYQIFNKLIKFNYTILILPLSIELFFRGVGYASIPFLLVIILIFNHKCTR